MTVRAVLAKADVAATTRYVLVDKSDATNFPHRVNSELVLRQLELSIDKEGATGDWRLRVGLVEEVDAENGTVRWFHVERISAATQVQRTIDFGERGLSLNTGLIDFISSDRDAGSTNWQTDVTLDNPTGTNVAPGAGDIVVEAEEIDGSATISFTVAVNYGILRSRQ